MYPEGGAGGAGAADIGGEGGFKSRFTANLEGIVPLILILIIVAYAGHKIGFWNIPFLGAREPAKMLVIGTLSFDERAILDEDKDLVRYVERDARALEVAARDQLAQYKIVMLEQSTQADKTVSRQLGEALQEWVKTGGRLIIVKDSGIYRRGAVDVIGWRATFGDIVPVECNYEKDYVPTCTRPIHVTGTIFRQDWKHRIMEGIEKAPAEANAVLFLETFNVVPTGNQIAFIQSQTSPAYYVGVAEKTWFGIGKVIYFNYDPGYTRGIFENTLEYLS